ncbi:acylamino-acid-releasing enzyme [Trifolium medium]|uniref:Acylamino-acid-releasing enzyme n=1 Tax=Trifolium medium TaxID=97028 RepID=A0A392PGH6_9FABA|nr:acylamino-acid-releasing enzyme [Trifolium medium]
MSKSRPKDSGDNIKFKCYHCHVSGHYKKDCSRRRGGGSSSARIFVNEEESYESAGELTVTSWELEKSWVMESGCSYHIYLDARPETGVEKIQFEVEPSTDEREEEDETQVPDESGS